MLGLLPHLAAWAKTLIDGALGAAGVQMTPELMAGMAMNGVLYHGLEVFGAGAILTGLILAAVAVFVIERKFEMAAAFAFAGAVLTFFGFMHGEAVGVAVTPGVAAAYVLVAGFLYACARFEKPSTVEAGAVGRRAAGGMTRARSRTPGSTRPRRWWELPIAEAYRPGVARFLELAAEMAAVLEAVDLDDSELALAPVFRLPDPE